MKRIYLIIITLIFPAFIFAQTVNDSVSMSAGYQYDIFYSLYSGNKPSALINNWDIAFCTNPMEVGIRVNSINGVNLWAIPGTDTTGWATVDSAGYQNWQELHNTDTAIYFGAFNVNYTSSQFDFSWGVYDFNTHEVIGDSLFLIKLTDLSGNIYFKKLWIIKRADNANHDWIFRYANLDNSGDMTVTVPTTIYSDKNFIYYSIINNNTTDREPANTDWDLQFTRYITDLGGGYYYPVMGIYSNYGVLVADVRPVDVAATNSDAPYLNLYSNHLNEIGHDWKTFNMATSMWEIEDSLVYFVKTNAGEVYKLVMTGFDGSSTGNVFFNKTLISTTGVNEIANNNSANTIVFPNPASGEIKILYNVAQKSNLEFQLSDINGTVVLKTQVKANSGMNGYSFGTQSLAKGVYILQLLSDNRSEQHKIIIE
jgi:hypothetical protein